MWYAIQWRYGVAVNSDGSRCGTYYSFASRECRDAWVGASKAEFITQRGYREPIASNDPELRAMLRRDRGETSFNSLRVIPADAEIDGQRIGDV
jgi:hypothetical protein